MSYNKAASDSVADFGRSTAGTIFTSSAISNTQPAEAGTPYPSQLVTPEAFDVGDAFIDLVDGQGGAEFEDFDVVGFDAGFESGEVNVA